MVFPDLSGTNGRESPRSDTSYSTIYHDAYHDNTSLQLDEGAQSFLPSTRSPLGVSPGDRFGPLLGVLP